MTNEGQRIPLHTRNVTEARERRDKLFAELAGKVLRKELAA